MTIYKKPHEFSVPFYVYVFQAFNSFGSYMEALKYINHDEKQICNVICHLLSREIGKNMSSGPCFCLFQEAANCWKTSGSSTSEVTHCFQALAWQCCCSGDEAEVILIPSKIRINTKKCLLWSILSYKLISMEEVLYTKVKNCPVQQRICLYGLGVIWPLVEPGLLFEHFFLLQPFATTQQLTSVISPLKAWEAELFQKGKDRSGASPVLDIYLSITTEHSRIQQPHCSQKWRIKIMQSLVCTGKYHDCNKVAE